MSHAVDTAWQLLRLAGILLCSALWLHDCGPLQASELAVPAGLPEAPNEQLLLLPSPAHTGGWSPARRSPAWTAYDIPAGPRPPHSGRLSTFQPDTRIPAWVSPRQDDYAHSGYDLGHCAPSDIIAEAYGDAAQRATYLMSNVMPQRPGLNRGPWKALETRAAADAARIPAAIRVYCGPVYLSVMPGHLPGGEQIPDACYRIEVRRYPNGPVEVRAWELPQAATGDPERYRCPVSEIERDTGLDFTPTHAKGSTP